MRNFLAKTEDKETISKAEKRHFFSSAEISSKFGNELIQRKADCSCGGGCPGCQIRKTDLSISSPDDASEKKADAMAEKVMRMQISEPTDFSSTKKSIQRKENSYDSTSATPSIVYDVINSSSGKSLDESTRSFMESRFNYDFSDVRVHIDAKAAESAASVNALAYTHGNHVVFGAGQYKPNSDSGKHLLAHELTHVRKQKQSLNRKIIQRQPDPKRQQSPQDKATVAAAKAKLAKLEPLLQQAENNKLGIDAERLRVLAARKYLDDNAADPSMPKKIAMEEYNTANLNNKPISIKQTASEITFNVQFQVLFEDSKMNGSFADVVSNVKAGIKLVWNQTLTGNVFGGRKFSIVPTFTLIGSKGRDQNYWLIHIRKTDTAKVKYPGCSLPQPDPGIPTSVTDTLCDGGVVSIPPLHIKKPGVLGHEILHLFGLIDRYFTLTSVKPGNKKVYEDAPVRETSGRKDPLGGEDGTILDEDLGYLFDKLGVYRQENQINEDVISLTKLEVMRLKRIVGLGYDPDSLLPIRKDFNDKIIKSAEDL